MDGGSDAAGAKAGNGNGAESDSTAMQKEKEAVGAPAGRLGGFAHYLQPRAVFVQRQCSSAERQALATQKN